MKCSNCGATFTADEIPRGACKFCGTVLQAGPGGPAGQAGMAPPVGTVGAHVDELLGSLGIQPGSPAMQQIQTFLATQQSFSAGGMIYRTLHEMPPEARRALMQTLVAQHQASLMGGGMPLAAFGPRPTPRRRGSGCGCFFFMMLLAVGGGVAYYLYYLPR